MEKFSLKIIDNVYKKHHFLFSSSIFNGECKNFSYESNFPEIQVLCSNGKHEHSSSKVKLKSVVDYKWDIKNYPGRLVAVHLDGKHIAYTINGKI